MRSKGHAQSIVNTGDLCINLDAKTVEVGGAPVHLTSKEYQMLELLSLRKIASNPEFQKRHMFNRGFTAVLDLPEHFAKDD